MEQPKDIQIDSQRNINPDFIQKFQKQYQLLQNDNESLCSKYEKLVIDFKHETQKQNEIKQILIQENNKLSKSLKETKQKLLLLESQKENFCGSNRLNKCENDKFQQFMGRGVQTPEDQKIMMLINYFESECQKYQAYSENLKNKNLEFSEIITKNELILKESQDDKKELISRVNELEFELRELITTNSDVMCQNEQITIQFEEIFKQNEMLQDQNNQLNLQIENRYQDSQISFQQQQEEIEDIDSIQCQSAHSTQQFNNKQQQIIEELMRIYQIEDIDILVQAALKTDKVIRIIPKLQSLIKQIIQIILPETEIQDIQNVVPTLEQWAEERNYIQQFIIFKNKLCEQLDLDGENFISDVDIFNKIRNIMHENKKDFCDVQRGDFLFQNFIKIIRKFLKIDDNVKTEIVLGQVIKMIENMKNHNKYQDQEIIYQLLQILMIEDPLSIVQKVEQLVQKVENYLIDSYPRKKLI